MKSSITYLADGKTENYNITPDKAGTYDYDIETPMKAIFSGAYVIGKSGLISVDYEIVDYSTAKLKNGGGSYDYYNENKVIQSAYKTVGNLHVGGEYRVNKNLSLRAGYENFPNAYQTNFEGAKNPNSDTSYSTVAGGFGFRQGSFFLDTTYKRIVSDEFYKLYPGTANMAHYEASQNTVILTFGYKF